MKTIITLLITAVLTLNVNAQSNPEKFTIEFLGVKIDGPLEACAQKFVAKGFKIVKREGNVYTMSGLIKSQSSELYLIGTPTSKLACKVSIYFPEDASWYGIKSDYESFKSLLVRKYGEPANDYHFFSSPYYEGDGYETTAVKIEKCHYAAFWNEEPSENSSGYNIILQISKFMQIQMGYENAKNMELKSKEESIIDNKNF